MAVTQKRLYGNDSVPNTLTTAYTVPASTSTNITCITITNKTATAAGVTVTISGITLTSLSNTLDGYSTTIIQLATVMNATEIIQVQASATSTIAVAISGVEVV